MKHFIFFFTFLFVFSACQQNDMVDPTLEQPTKINYSTKNAPFNQKVAKKAEEIAESYDGVPKAISVNTDRKLLLTFQLDHMKRFQLKQKEKTIEKKLKKSFRDYDVTVSSDMKIYWETEKLINKLENLDKREMNKKVENIIQLSREET